MASVDARRAGRTGVRFLIATTLSVALGTMTLAEDRPTHQFQELAPGVFFATETGSMMLMSNSLVIVNEEDVVIVDSHVTPAAAQALLDSVRTLTAKPVSYLVNTHYHFDHAHGNQAFPPGVVIVGHEFTREKLAGDPLGEATFTRFMELFDDNLSGLRRQLAAASDPRVKADLQEQIRVLAKHIEDSQGIVPTPPELTLADRLTLWRGQREIQVRFLGRGHTGGDVVVFLPAEKIVFTGDLMLPGPSYMGDGFVDEWVDTLERLEELDFELLVPGHGEPFRDRERVDRVQAYLTDLWQRTVALHAQGVPALEAALRIDLTVHRPALGEFTSPLLPAGIHEPGVDAAAVLRIYELLEERRR